MPTYIGPVGKQARARAPANAYLNMFDGLFGILCVNTLLKCCKWSRTRFRALFWTMRSRILVLE